MWAWVSLAIYGPRNVVTPHSVISVNVMRETNDILILSAFGAFWQRYTLRPSLHSRCLSFLMDSLIMPYVHFSTIMIQVYMTFSYSPLN